MPLQFNALLFRPQHYIAITSSEEGGEEIVITGIDLWHKKKQLAYTKRKPPIQMEHSQGFFPLLLETCSKKKKMSLSPITSCIHFD